VAGTWRVMAAAAPLVKGKEPSTTLRGSSSFASWVSGAGAPGSGVRAVRRPWAVSCAAPASPVTLPGPGPAVNGETSCYGEIVHSPRAGNFPVAQSFPVNGAPGGPAAAPAVAAAPAGAQGARGTGPAAAARGRGCGCGCGCGCGQCRRGAAARRGDSSFASWNLPWCREFARPHRDCRSSALSSMVR